MNAIDELLWVLFLVNMSVELLIDNWNSAGMASEQYKSFLKKLFAT